MTITTKQPTCVCAKLLQSCPALCDSMDCSPPGSSVPGLLQAGILEWVARPSSRASSRPRGLSPHLLCLLHWQVGSLPPAPPRMCVLSSTAYLTHRCWKDSGSGGLRWHPCQEAPVVVWATDNGSMDMERSVDLRDVQEKVIWTRWLIEMVEDGRSRNHGWQAGSIFHWDSAGRKMGCIQHIL